MPYENVVFWLAEVNLSVSRLRDPDCPFDGSALLFDLIRRYRTCSTDKELGIGELQELNDHVFRESIRDEDRSEAIECSSYRSQHVLRMSCIVYCLPKTTVSS